MYRCQQNAKAVLVGALTVVAKQAAAAENFSVSGNDINVARKRDAGGHDHVWYEEEYEADTVEMLVLAVLMTLAIFFEYMWRCGSRWAERSYVFGQANRDESKQYQGCGAAPEGHVGHLQLKKELVDRAAREFMTLGFLAACTFTLNMCGALKALAHHFHPGGLALPLTDEDWLHLIEIVHMKLFVAMLFYFILIFVTIVGAMKKMQEWEGFQGRVAFARRSGRTLEREEGADKKLKVFLGWRCYFVVHIFHWARDCPDRYQALLDTLGLEHPEQEDFRKRLEERLPFGAYLSLNVEAGICDSIQLHGVTWMAMVPITVLSAVLHKCLRIGISALALGFVVITIVALAVIYTTVQAKMQGINRTAESLSREVAVASPPKVDEEVRPKLLSLSSKWTTSTTGLSPWRCWLKACSCRTGFHERHPTELVVLRMLQVACVLLSFGVAHTLLDVDGWHYDPATVALELVFTLGLYLVPAFCMPSQVPLFLVVMSLPPCVDDGNMEALIAAIKSRGTGSSEEDRVKNFISTKDLLIAATRSSHAGETSPPSFRPATPASFPVASGALGEHGPAKRSQDMRHTRSLPALMNAASDAPSGAGAGKPAAAAPSQWRQKKETDQQQADLGSMEEGELAFGHKETWTVGGRRLVSL
jgi:hypothetical protein